MFLILGRGWRASRKAGSVGSLVAGILHGSGMVTNAFLVTPTDEENGDHSPGLPGKSKGGEGVSRGGTRLAQHSLPSKDRVWPDPCWKSDREGPMWTAQYFRAGTFSMERSLRWYPVAGDTHDLSMNQGLADCRMAGGGGVLGLERWKSHSCGALTPRGGFHCSSTRLMLSAPYHSNRR